MQTSLSFGVRRPMDHQQKQLPAMQTHCAELCVNVKELLNLSCITVSTINLHRLTRPRFQDHTEIFWDDIVFQLTNFPFPGSSIIYFYPPRL